MRATTRFFYTDPTGKDIVPGSCDQRAIRNALVEIASHPGGREFLTKLEKLTVQIKVSTGTGLTNRSGDPACGKTVGTIQRVTDKSGNVSDVKGHIETTIDPALAKQDHKDGVSGVPKSDAELLGHELKHDENQFYKQPDSEDIATKGIDAILDTPATKDLTKDAGQFVDNLLQSNQSDQNQNQNNQNQTQDQNQNPPQDQQSGSPSPEPDN